MAGTNPQTPLGQSTFRFVEVDDINFNDTRTVGGQWGQHKNTVDYFIKKYLERHANYTNGRFEL